MEKRETLWERELKRYLHYESKDIFNILDRPPRFHLVISTTPTNLFFEIAWDEPEAIQSFISIEEMLGGTKAKRFHRRLVAGIDLPSTESLRANALDKLASALLIKLAMLKLGEMKNDS